MLCPPPRHRGRGDGHSSRHPSPRPRCLRPPHRRHTNSLPAQGAPPASAFAHIHMDSASLRYCAAVQRRSCSCPCFTLLPQACLSLSSADLAVADSPLFVTTPPGRPLCSDAAGRRSAGQFLQLRTKRIPNDDSVRHFTKKLPRAAELGPHRFPPSRRTAVVVVLPIFSERERVHMRCP